MDDVKVREVRQDYRFVYEHKISVLHMRRKIV